MQANPIKKLGHGLFIGVTILWALSSVLPVPPFLMLAFPLAWIVPRFLFHKLGARMQVRWEMSDWLWLGAALMISIASFFRLDPVTVVKAIIMSVH